MGLFLGALEGIDPWVALGTWAVGKWLPLFVAQGGEGIPWSHWGFLENPVKGSIGAGIPGSLGEKRDKGGLGPRLHQRGVAKSSS